MTRIPRWIIAYSVLLLISSGTALLIVPIMASTSRGAELVFTAHQYILAPVISLAVTASAARRGVDPYAAFFPPFLCQWLLPPLFALRALPVSVGLTFIMGVIGANAGKELLRRKGMPRRGGRI